MNADLSTAKAIIARKTKDVHNKLRNSIASNPEEYRLTVFNQEQAVPFQTFRCQRKWGWQNYAIFTNGTSLSVMVSLPGIERNRAWGGQAHLRRHVVQ